MRCRRLEWKPPAWMLKFCWQRQWELTEPDWLWLMKWRRPQVGFSGRWCDGGCGASRSPTSLDVKGFAAWSSQWTHGF